MDYWRSDISKKIVQMDNLKVINPVNYETLTIHLLKKYVDDVLVALE